MSLYKDTEENKEYSQSVITYIPYEQSQFPDSLSMTIEKQEEYDGIVEPLKTICPEFAAYILSGRDTEEEYHFPIEFQGLLGESSKIRRYDAPVLSRSNFSVDSFAKIVHDYMRTFEDSYYNLGSYRPAHFSSHNALVYDTIKEKFGFDEGGEFNTNKQLPYEDLVAEILAETHSATEWRRREKRVRITLEVCMRIAIFCNFIRLYNMNPVHMMSLNLKKLNVHPFNPNFENVNLGEVEERRRWSGDPGFATNRNGVENVTHCWRPYSIDYAKAIVNAESGPYAVVKDVFTPIFAFRDNSIKKKGTGVDIFYAPMCSQNYYRNGERPMYSIGNASTMDKATEKAKVFCTECLMLQHACDDDYTSIDRDTGGLGVNLLYMYDEFALNYDEWIERVTNVIRHHVSMIPPEYKEMVGRFLSKNLHFDINNPVFGGNYGRKTA